MGGGGGHQKLVLSQRLPLFQALPYVALLIAMLFFIYAVIGMQVSTSHFPPASPSLGSPRSVARLPWPGRMERQGCDFPAKRLGY